MEININIAEDSSGMVYVSSRRERVSKRNIVDAGAGALKGSIGFAMCFVGWSFLFAGLQNHKLGDLSGVLEISHTKKEKKDAHNLNPFLYPRFVVASDPMCGVGTIPIESANAWPSSSFWMCGDIRVNNVTRTIFNASHAGLGDLINCCKWDGTCLPLKDQQIDLIVSDLPFGKKHGSHAENRKMYPLFLEECARVLKFRGVAVLLSLETKLMDRTLNSKLFLPLFIELERFTVNHGNLQPVLIVLRRRNPPKSKNIEAPATIN
eukprot:TRINITY_DN1637_c0_g1_i1.p1 TRINITY_DN1637_c0_g1~~TRINITY_DN1637_c0_g1_i1.p1  ORF type:complete len:264 (-),score=35.41 TRINITY_DN1637_c0_g1_i1:119-910(-)